MATTQWSQVLAARDGSESEARSALEGLCRTYWEPLYAFIRHQGSNPDDAADLTQAFFAEFLEKRALSSVDPSKGRFRSFLLASLKHFLSHQRDRAAALKRGGGKRDLSFDVEAAERRFALRASEESSPEATFEYRWAVTMLNRALARLRQDALDAGRDAQFDALKQYLTSLEEQVPYEETARALGTSVGSIKMAVSRLRQRFGSCLRAEVADTVADLQEVDDEVRHLIATLRSREGGA